MKFLKKNIVCESCNNSSFSIDTYKDKIRLICINCGKEIFIDIGNYKKIKKRDSSIVMILSKVNELEDNYRRLLYRIENLERKVENIK